MKPLPDKEQIMKVKAELERVVKVLNLDGAEIVEYEGETVLSVEGCGRDAIDISNAAFDRELANLEPINSDLLRSL